MKFFYNEFYHVFNRGNNRQSVFPLERNYQFFEDKLKSLILPNCSIVAYCLMPNHYHLLLYIEKPPVHLKIQKDMQVLERRIGTLQSSYTRAINIQERRTGSLFQSSAKVLELSLDHAFTCFHYIHQNPLKAGLVNSMKDWKHSSYKEYLQPSEGGLCNSDIAYELMDIPSELNSFVRQSLDVIVDEKTITSLEGH